MLDKLEKMPKDQANAIMTAITESIECSMQNHAHDADLLAVKPRFDAIVKEAWNRHEDSELWREAFEAELERRTGLNGEQGFNLDRDSPEFEAWRTARIALVDERSILSCYAEPSDEEVDRDAAEFNGLIDEILRRSPVTREGMALQCRALVMDFFGEWDDGNNKKVMWFVAKVMDFLNKDLELPPALADEVFG